MKVLELHSTEAFHSYNILQGLRKGKGDKVCKVCRSEMCVHVSCVHLAGLEKFTADLYVSGLPWFPGIPRCKWRERCKGEA